MDVSSGRINTDFNGIIIGLESKETKLKPNSIYDIVEQNGQLVLKRVGRANTKFNEGYDGIGTMILVLRQAVVMTSKEARGKSGLLRWNVPVKRKLRQFKFVPSLIGKKYASELTEYYRLKSAKKLSESDELRLNELTDSLSKHSLNTNFLYNRAYLKFLEFIRDNKEVNFDKYEKLSDDELDRLLDEFKEFFA